MSKLKELLKWSGILSIVFILCALPAMTQDAGKSGCGKCAGDEKPKACGGGCGGDEKAKDCCGGCGGAASAPAPAGGDFMAAASKCNICKTVFEDMELIMACEYSIVDYSQGIICLLHLKDPKLMKKFRAFGERDKKLCEKYRAMKKEKRVNDLCPSCNKYFAFLKKGMKEERIETPNGALSILSTTDPALLKEIHAWSAKMRKDIAAVDAMMSGQEPQPAPACEIAEQAKSGCGSGAK